jgi:hypothetical protein
MRTTPMQTKMHETTWPCWKCSAFLWHLDPPVYGWSWYCQRCQHLTSKREELERALAENPADAIGVVAAVPCRIEMAPVEAAS